MTAAPVRAPASSRFWPVPVVRGILALAGTAAITFSPNHSPEFGLVVFGVWAIVTGLVIGALTLRLVEDRPTRTIFALSAVVTVVAGLLAVSVPGGLPFFLFLVSAWAAITGFLELFAGLRGRGRDASARDRIAAGVFTAVLAVVFLLLPPDSVTAVGLFGAYLAILGVYLVIGGFSLKWSANQSAEAGAADAGGAAGAGEASGVADPDGAALPRTEQS
ncbi:HdeD family acid-resistance protein [Agromyces soli]